MTESIEQYELADRLRDIVVGHKIVSGTEDSITLDTGVKLEISGSSDCCAWGDATFGKLADSTNVITGVKFEEDELGEQASIFLLTDSGSTALNVDQSWDSSNGYYFYGLYLTVTGVQNANNQDA